MMTEDANADLIDSCWEEASEALSGLGNGGHAVLNTANGALDTVWDRYIFEKAETFGGAEIGYARALSASILARLLNVDYVGLASATGTVTPISGDERLDAELGRASQDTLNTFAEGLLGPEEVGGRLVYAQPILLESPIPVGAVLIATGEPLTSEQQRLLQGALRHLDTRMSLAEQLLRFRTENHELRFENKTLKGESVAPEPVKRTRLDRAPEDFSQAVDEFASSVPRLDLFRIELPMTHFDEFCGNFDSLTDRYLSLLENAPHLFLDVPSSIDAKDESKLAAPYFRLLEVMGSLRIATRLMFQANAEDLAPYAAEGRAPTFADLTRFAKQRTEDETTERILEIMNDEGEDEELDALYARSHPYEFRAANIGEVFALLALHRTVMNTMPESVHELREKVLQALPKYQAARAFLLSYDRFEDLPLQGVIRFQLPDSEKLLLQRENAPAFGTLLWALRQET